MNHLGAMCRGLAALIVLLLSFGQGRTQYPYPPQPYPVPPQVVPPPLLYVKIIGPEGMKVTFYRPAGPQTFSSPASFGLRPGFGYRFKVSDIPALPGVALYPTLEVRGTMLLGHRQRNTDFPVALVFRADDFNAVKSGSMVTKVVVLERPENAFPLASKADDPLQIDVSARMNPLQESQLRGRALLLLHMGQRQVSDEELTATSISGTVLMPGERVLPLPRALPWVPWDCIPVYDPVLGPPHPSEEITLYDGGDSGLRAGLERDGKLRGLDPSDTVAQYTDSRGRSHLAVSNRVAVCVPRFVVFRGETTLAGELAMLGPNAATVAQGRQVVESRVPPLEQHQNQQLAGMAGTQRPSSNINSSGTAIVGQLRGTTVTASVQETGSVQGLKEPPMVQLPDKPLKIIKFPEKCGGLIGDVITFTIRFSNAGGQPITNVIVSDSLTTRFEYVPGSSKSDRPATFTTQGNDAGSMLLRWEFPGTLQPGESGTISFQVKIR